MDAKPAKEKRPGRIKRMGASSVGYAKRRFAPRETRLASVQMIKSGYRLATEGFSLRDIDRDDMIKGFRGRYPDGGREAFKKMVEWSGHTDEALEASRITHRRSAFVFLAADAVSFLLSPYTIMTADSFMFVLVGICFLMVSLVFSALAMRHFYYAWQIEKRALGSLSDYLAGREPGGYAALPESADRNSRSLKVR